MAKQKFNIGDKVYIKNYDTYREGIICGIMKSDGVYRYYMQGGGCYLEDSLVTSLDDAYMKEIKIEDERHLREKQRITEKFSAMKKGEFKPGNDYDIDKETPKNYFKMDKNASQLFADMLDAYNSLFKDNVL